MYLERFYDDDLAMASYLLASDATKEAIVVDPRREVDLYVRAAEAKGYRIVAVTETHVHADFLSGARELAEATGADLYLSAEGPPEWRYRFDHHPLHDGDVIELGDLGLSVLHTPGHTPEHVSFLVTDGSRGDEPALMLTGDFMFVNDIGRPDLLDAAAGYQDTRFEGAKQMFRSLKRVVAEVPAHVAIWPGHGAGSACGKSLSAVPSSTVGYESLTAWWAGLLEDEEAYTAELLSGQPDAPTYFGRMKRQNVAGPARLGDRPPLRGMAPDELAGRVNREVVLIDTRALKEQRAATLPGALSVPGGGSFATYAAYAIDPETEERPLVLVAEGPEHAERLRQRLAYVGIDEVAGFFADVGPLTAGAARLIEPEEAVRRADELAFLDVRTEQEHAEGAAPGAVRVYVGQVTRRLDEVPRGKPLVVYCQGGGRAAVVASLLRNRGLADVIELASPAGTWPSARDRD